MVLIDRLTLLAEDGRAFGEGLDLWEVEYHGREGRLSAVTGGEWVLRNPDVKGDSVWDERSIRRNIRRQLGGTTCL